MVGLNGHAPLSPGPRSSLPEHLIKLFSTTRYFPGILILWKEKLSKSISVLAQIRHPTIFSTQESLSCFPISPKITPHVCPHQIVPPTLLDFHDWSTPSSALSLSYPETYRCSLTFPTPPRWPAVETLTGWRSHTLLWNKQSKIMLPDD